MVPRHCSCVSFGSTGPLDQYRTLLFQVTNGNCYLLAGPCFESLIWANSILRGFHVSKRLEEWKVKDDVILIFKKWEALAVHWQ